MIVTISTAVTVVGLFGVQEIYRSFAGADARRDRYAEFAARNEIVNNQRARLQRGRMPIDQAIRTLANESRDRLALIAPEPSADPAPAAGWMHSPRYVDPAGEPEGDDAPDDAPGEAFDDEGGTDEEEPLDGPADAAPTDADGAEGIDGETPAAPPTTPRGPRGGALGAQDTAEGAPATRLRPPNPRLTVPAVPAAPGQATP
jgi:hypothetical protein